MSEEHGSRQLEQEVEDYLLVDADSRKSKLCMWWDHDIFKVPVTLSSLKTLLTLHPQQGNQLGNITTVKISDWGTFFIQTMTVTKATWSSAGTAETCPCCPINWTVWSSDPGAPPEFIKCSTKFSVAILLVQVRKRCTSLLSLLFATQFLVGKIIKEYNL